VRTLSEFPSADSRRAWRLRIFIGLLAAACLWLSFQFIEPIPPRQIVLASGPESSLYHEHAKRYVELMARHGLTVVEKITEGPGENLELLSDPKSGVDVAFVQGGQADSQKSKDLVMLASLYYQPLWIFVRRGESFESLAKLAGKKVSLGMPGSGTNVLGTPLLEANGVTEKTATFIHVPTDRTRAVLHAKEVDAALMVGGVRTPAVTAALADPSLELVSLAHADAYPQRYRYLTRRTLYRGAVSFVPTVPSQDISLLATEAMLAARHTLHPAIVNLLLEVIRDEHDDQGYFETPGEFPNWEQVDLPVSPDAVRHKRFGPSPLYRYLPFWVATFVERFIIIVLPLLLVVLPVVQQLPRVLNWRARSSIYRWYGELKLLERDVAMRGGDLPIEKWLADVDRIERAAEQLRTPSSLASESYTLREHIRLVRSAVLAKAGAASSAALRPEG
jgi:TRAP transporter TAXI family solute receptor